MFKEDDVLSGSESSEGWDDVEAGSANEEDTLDIVSLVDDKVFPDAASMLKYCRDKSNFDFVATRDRLGLDFYGSIQLVNYVRDHVKQGKTLPEHMTNADIQHEKYLIPVLPDDAFIMCLDSLPPSSSDAPQASSSETCGEDSVEGHNASLRAELDELTKQFSNYRLAVVQTLDKRWHADEDDHHDSSPGSAAGSDKDEKDESQYYWESYAHNDIHETMLRDTVRTEAYRDFIYNNKHLFKGKTVLDIGCGTGILSMFCAKAGAAHVYAIDKSAIIDKARENIFHNDLFEHITCLRGRVEDILLPVDKVDIIVSEWMGYCLLYEAMLPSVLFARDRYLKADGLLVPSHATIFLAPLSDPDYVTDNVGFWRDVYGFDMKAMQDAILKDVRVETMPGSSVCGSTSAHALDLYHVKAEDLTFRADWASALSRDVEAVDGFLIWFDNYFAATRQAHVELIESPAEVWVKSRGDGSVAFTTGPHGRATHWKQGLLLVEHKDGDARPRKAGDQTDGSLSFSVPDDHSRGLSIRMTWDGLPNAAKTQTWALH